MLVLLSDLLPGFWSFRAAGKGYADDLPEDEFFDQKSGSEREGQPTDNHQELQHRFHDNLLVSHSDRANPVSTKSLLPAAGAGFALNFSEGISLSAEYGGNLLVAFAANLHRIAHIDEFEQFFE